MTLTLLIPPRQNNYLRPWFQHKWSHVPQTWCTIITTLTLKMVHHERFSLLFWWAEEDAVRDCSHNTAPRSSSSWLLRHSPLLLSLKSRSIRTKLAASSSSVWNASKTNIGFLFKGRNIVYRACFYMWTSFAHIVFCNFNCRHGTNLRRVIIKEPPHDLIIILRGDYH